MSKSKIAFIVEGSKTEINILKSIKKLFDYEIELIILPAEKNISMLYEEIKADDDFETILLINQLADKTYKINDFSQIYLFFDFDIQHNLHDYSVEEIKNHCKLVDDMLKTFNNETENGKLYVSYPMVEALRDIPLDNNNCYKNCVIDLCAESFKCYKSISSANIFFTDHRKYDYSKWKIILSHYIKKLECLTSEKIDFQTYTNISSNKILELIKIKLEDQNKLFILSGVSEFLLDYFKEENFNLYTKK